MEKERIRMNGQRKTTRFPDAKSKASFIAVISCLFLLCLLLQPAAAASPPWPPTQPIPRIETGTHTAPIWRIGVDAQEHFLVTASKDKTVRVWDLGNGNLLKILRVPMGGGPFEGQLYCVAISPDGAKVAAAGYTGVKRLNKFNIYIFDRDSGQLRHVIPNLPVEIGHLTFSRDGQYLAATLVGEQGLRVYNSHDWVEVGKDPKYGHDSYGADFGPSPQNQLVTTSYDGCLRLYEPQDGKFKRILIQRLANNSQPATVRFSPDGSRLAVGFVDSHRVEVFSGKTLASLYKPDLKGTGQGHLARVSWSKNGDLLYAGGGAAEAGKNQVLCWTQAGRGSATRFPASFNAIMDLYPLADGRLVFGAVDPAFGILDSAGRRVLAKVPNTPDFRNQQKDFRISKDGRVVEFGFTIQNPDQLSQEHYWARLDTKNRQFTLLDSSAKPLDQELRPADTTGFKDSDWENTKPYGNPKFRGIYDPYTKSYSLARIPEGRGFILGTDWEMLFFAENGKPLFYEGKNYEPEGKVIFLPGSAHCLNVSGDGKVAVAALGDGSLRWYHLDDGKEILAFLRHRDGNWVMWSPEGFFTCSPNGGKLLGYHLNQGPDHTPQFVTSNQLYDQFYRNDLVGCHLEKISGDKIQAALPNGTARKVLADSPPPVVEIVSREKLNDCDYLYKIKITDGGGGIGQIVYRLNGDRKEPTISRQDDEIMPGRTIPVPSSRVGSSQKDMAITGRIVSIPITFEPGVEQNTSFSAFNKGNTAESAAATDSIKVPGKASHSLYILSIGVGKYQGQYLELPFAARDAQKFALELKARGEGIFQSVTSIPLVDEDASLDKIEKTFAGLVNKIKREDVLIVFLSGHGSLKDSRYHFMPFNPDPSKPKSLSQENLNKWLRLIKAWRKVVILDTCHAGAFADDEARIAQRLQVEDTAFARLCNDSGLPTLAACADRQLALDGYKGHGVFTYLLLQGLSGAADLRCNGGDGNDRIALIELYMYLRAKVPETTMANWHYEQKPWINLRGQEELVIAAVKNSGLAKGRTDE